MRYSLKPKEGEECEVHEIFFRGKIEKTAIDQRGK